MRRKIAACFISLGLLLVSCQAQQSQDQPPTLTASFTCSPGWPFVGQAVQFTDTSTGSPTSWQWSFGDGITSTNQNPSHSYAAAATYSVTLTVTNSSGSRNASQTLTVRSEASGYYIDTNSPSASDSNPGTETLPWKTITKANQTLAAGDTVYIKAGTYTGQYISPANSGTAGLAITYSRYGTDIVTIRDSTQGVTLNGKSYINVDGINFYNCTKFMYLNGSSHCTISYCNFDQQRTPLTEWAASRMYNNSTYNWIHHCQFSKAGDYSGSARGSIFDIGTEASSTDATMYNLIENNTLFHGGHHCLGIFGKYNVIRNNYLHNEAWWSGLGFRIMYLSGYAASGCWNLIEGNRIGYAGDYQVDNSSAGIKLISQHNIIRKNLIYHNTGTGITMDENSGYLADIVYNKIYHNTFLHNGFDPDRNDQQSSAMCFARYNAGTLIVKYQEVKNNLFYNHPRVFGASGASLSDQTFAGNWDGDTQGNPLFVNGASADPSLSTLPDLRLQAGSPCKDVGTFLTTITSSSGSGTIFTVANAGFFMDGWGISGVDGDEIQIVGTSQKARITSINYSTNAMTVDTSLTWTTGQGIALSYVGSAPDPGAYEYGGDQLSSSLMSMNNWFPILGRLFIQ